MRILYWLWIAFGIVLLWCCGFLTGRITAPEPPPNIVYVKPKSPAKKSKPARVIYTSKRGKKYYLTPAGNKVYLKESNPGA